MGKKGAPSPEPAKEEEPVEEPEPPPEHLHGEFVFPDGSKYDGWYLKKSENVCFHGEGTFTTGPEVFKGTFENGFYKKGTYTGCNGSYDGSFLNGLFNGPGQYKWSDGRMYHGLWKDGQMHGWGRYENFHFGVDRIVEGFSVRGSFSSSVIGQEDARKAFLAEYGTEYAGSAAAALRDLVARLEGGAKAPDGKGGPPPAAIGAGALKEFLVPSPPPQGEPEEPEAVAERSALQKIVVGPFPEAAAFSPAKLKAFAELFPEGTAQQGVVTIFESKDCERFDGSRLRCDQLSHVGQGVELLSPQAEGGTLRLLVFVNVSPEYDVARAQWKIIACEEVPPSDDQLAAAETAEKGKKGK